MRKGGINTNLKRGPLIPKLPKSGFSEHINRSSSWHLSQWKRQSYRRPRKSRVKESYGYQDSELGFWPSLAIGTVILIIYLLL